MNNETPLERPRNKRRKLGFPTVLAIVGLGLIMLAIVLIVWFFMHGEEVTTGDWTAKEVARALTCEANNKEYPFFAYDNSIKTNTKIEAIFNNDDELETISLRQTMYYADSNDIKVSENHNRAAMNQSFGENGLGVDTLNATFTSSSDSLKMTLFAKNSTINNKSAEYFFLNKLDGKGNYTVSMLQKNYTNKGFSCNLTGNNK